MERRDSATHVSPAQAQDLAQDLILLVGWEAAGLGVGNRCETAAHRLDGEGLKTELGATGGQRLDDASDVVANEDEAGNLGRCFLLV